jgi:four helix bundle protein
MGGFKELNVWKDAKILAVEIYRITQQEQFSQAFSLKEQIRKSNSERAQ